MKTTNSSLLPWFNGVFYFGVIFSLLAFVALVYEIIQNDNWFVESLIGHLGMGLLFLYFSGKPMTDERIRYLKFKGLAIGFVIASISATIINYIVTYPDGFQDNAISSYWFALICLLIAFISFRILEYKE